MLQTECAANVVVAIGISGERSGKYENLEK